MYNKTPELIFTIGFTEPHSLPSCPAPGAGGGGRWYTAALCFMLLRWMEWGAGGQHSCVGVEPTALCQPVSTMKPASSCVCVCVDFRAQFVYKHVV